ncbi:MAG: LysR family transcriptional regulator [Oceanospirillaceae bacterium]|nr:LysR family transcriptional regulator [Oceanospirillaceae bacterium]
MDLSSLNTFLVVAQEGNLTRAAERLCLTQPALSHQLKKLQSELGVQLMQRGSRGMQLTEEGLKLLPAAERAVRAAAEFSASASSLKSALSGKLKLGSIIDPGFLRLGRVLKLLASQHPVLQFDLTHGMSGRVSRQVEQGELDVAYTLGQPGLPEYQGQFSVLSLTQFRYRVIAPPGWQSLVNGRGWHELASLPWIWTPEDSAHNRFLSTLFGTAGVRPNIVAQVDLEPSMADLVRSGVGLSLARESLALEAAHLEGVVIADKVSVEAELGFICRKERRTETAIEAAFDAVGAVWRS